MRVYVDMAALIALVHKRDASHAEAVTVYQRLLQENARFLTTYAVLLEVGNTFSKSIHKPFRVPDRFLPATAIGQRRHMGTGWIEL